MVTKSTHTNDGTSKDERERIHIALLKEAIKGIGDLKAGKTLNLAQIERILEGRQAAMALSVREAHYLKF